MSEICKPILFSGPMVLAILSGAKTQTRRVVKPQPAGGVRESVFFPSCLEDAHGREIRIPYHEGDLLWVREAHTFAGSDGESFVDVCYKADDAVRLCTLDMDDAEKVALWIESKEDAGDGGDNWRPSIHMPRWASRLTLKIVSVRIQNLHCITEEDARAEGCTGEHFDTALQDFIWLWDEINGRRPGCAWEDNPFVWRIEFEKVET